ncbi:hypothetical protein [Tardiphaga sp. 367_B4_N1_1]|uniref:hypothetical protein n=1 Tax=Tardiphaga sp. 367_B4_N1_1 TaxID=3240777 RepID=UPI003F1F6A48
MKFARDNFGDLSLDHKDRQGDRLRVTLFDDGSNHPAGLISVNGIAVSIGHKKLRKLAKQILKETRE